MVSVPGLWWSRTAGYTTPTTAATKARDSARIVRRVNMSAEAMRDADRCNPLEPARGMLRGVGLTVLRTRVPATTSRTATAMEAPIIVSRSLVSKCDGQTGSHQGLISFSLLNTLSTSAALPRTARDRHVDNASRRREEVRMMSLVMVVEGDGIEGKTGSLRSTTRPAREKSETEEAAMKQTESPSIGQWVNIGSCLLLVPAYYILIGMLEVPGRYAFKRAVDRDGSLSARLTISIEVPWIWTIPTRVLVACTGLV